MTEADQLRLDLPLILPGVDNARDQCVARLIGLLAGRPGIGQAHIVGAEGPSPELCIHYDPATIFGLGIATAANVTDAKLAGGSR